MPRASHWTCPFCNHSAIIRDNDKWSTSGSFDHPLVAGETQTCVISAVFCPNPDCKRSALVFELYGLVGVSGSRHRGLIRRWSLMPESNARSFPDYIPTPI